MLIASGRSTRQVVAIAENLADKLKQSGRGYIPVEGKQTGDWVLVDAGDVIVHVFRPEARTFYALEKMWALEDEAAAKPVKKAAVKKAVVKRAAAKPAARRKRES
jgi:ribosomal silencing factor RsfS